MIPNARIRAASVAGLVTLSALAALLFAADGLGQSNAKPAAAPARAARPDYQAARYDPLHFPPASLTATNAQCLACHREILTDKPLAKSPAGVEAVDSLAWYQTLDTYRGEQMSFHQRHLSSPFAKQVMNLSCSFCHQGLDPREEAPEMMPAAAGHSAAPPPFTLRKQVNPTETCLRCHGAMPDPQTIMGLPGHWPEFREALEPEGVANGCMTCHAAFRTVRHQVSYLNAAGIEEAGKAGSDACYGCHGGRSWYRISYPYPRTPWPGMDASNTPDWAKGRPAHSEPRYALPARKSPAKK